MKYLFLLPVFLFYIIRDFATLVQHQDFLRSITYIILFTAACLFFAAWLDLAKEQCKIKRKLGNTVYQWLEGED